MSVKGGARRSAIAALLATCSLAFAATSCAPADDVASSAAATSAKPVAEAPAATSVFMTSTGLDLSAPKTDSARSAVVAKVLVRPLIGANVSGGEFGSTTGAKLGYTYGYPTTTEIDYFAASGMQVLRIPFRWERLQPTLYGPLSEADRTGLKNTVTYALSKGLTVVLDMHSYGTRVTDAGNITIGTSGVTESALADGWLKIANDYRNEPRVWLGLMNEPNKQATTEWWPIVQQLTTDLRNQQITNKLLVPGTRWTGAHSWISSGNAAKAALFVDPLNNFAFEVHQYLDSNSSGTSAICTAGSASRVDAAISWAVLHKVQLYFGEVGGSGDPSCAVEYPAMLAKLNASPAVVAWTAWGGGRWWNSTYMFRLNPLSGVTTPHMQMVLNARTPLL